MGLIKSEIPKEDIEIETYPKLSTSDIEQIINGNNEAGVPVSDIKLKLKPVKGVGIVINADETTPKKSLTIKRKFQGIKDAEDLVMYILMCITTNWLECL